MEEEGIMEVEERDKDNIAYDLITVNYDFRKIRSEFVEAELSGSEAESDEDLDLMEEEDIVEV